MKKAAIIGLYPVERKVDPDGEDKAKAVKPRYPFDNPAVDIDTKVYDYVASLGIAAADGNKVDYSIEGVYSVKADEVRGFLKHYRGTKVVGIVPSQAIFPRFVKLPPVAHDKIEQIVKYEAEQNVPFPIQEVTWGYKIRGQDSGELKVMLSAAKRESLETLFPEIRLAAVCDPNEAIARLYTRRIAESGIGHAGIIFYDGTSTNMIVADSAGIVFSRTIPVPGYVTKESTSEEFRRAFGGRNEYETMMEENIALDEIVEKANKTTSTKVKAELTRSINFVRSQQGIDDLGGLWVIDDRLAANIAHLGKYPMETKSPYEEFASIGNGDQDLFPPRVYSAAAVMAWPNGLNLLQSGGLYRKPIAKVIAGNMLYGLGTALSWPLQMLAMPGEAMKDAGESMRRK